MVKFMKESGKIIRWKEKVRATKQTIGTLNHSNGDKYEGEFSEGKKHGKGLLHITALGIMNYADEAKYEGNWVNDEKNGQGILCLIRTLGVMTYSNGDKYDGEWKDNKKEGDGSSLLGL